MKNVILSGLVIALLTGGCVHEKKSPIEGFWKLVYGHWCFSDTLFYQFPGNMNIYHIKIFSDDNFNFVGHFSLDSLIQDNGVNPFSSDTLTHDNYGGGTFTLKGDKYEENILFIAGATSINRKVRLILKVQNDTLIQKWPADENWKLAENYNIEKYIRLK